MYVKYIDPQVNLYLLLTESRVLADEPRIHRSLYGHVEVALVMVVP